MPKKIFITPEGQRVEDEAVEVEPSLVTVEEPIIWEYEDEDLSLQRVILDPHGVKLWKAMHETDGQGYPLMSFEPGFEAEPREKNGAEEMEEPN
jgi:hypothetical protein